MIIEKIIFMLIKYYEDYCVDFLFFSKFFIFLSNMNFTIEEYSTGKSSFSYLINYSSILHLLMYIISKRHIRQENIGVEYVLLFYVVICVMWNLLAKSVFKFLIRALVTINSSSGNFI